MIFADFLKAIAQLGDVRFRRVVLIGAGLALALLIGIYALFLAFIQTFAPDTLEIPFVGPVGGLDTLLSAGSLLLMVGLSVVLMVPVASAFTAIFLEDVADVVEDRHYPGLPPAPGQSLLDNLVGSVNFLGLLLAANFVAVAAYPFAGFAAPLLFWGLNGWLLGREYFALVASRRIGREAARKLRRAHGFTIFSAGVLMAAPLSVPLLNLIIPVLGVATFTHLFQRLRSV